MKLDYIKKMSKKTKNTKRYLGAHINAGFTERILLSSKYNINSVQIMPTNPLRWATNKINPEKAQKLYKLLPKTPIEKILLHSVYLINLARKDKQKFHLSKMSLVNYLDFSEEMRCLAVETMDAVDNTNTTNTNQNNHSKKIEILGVCFHSGSAIDLSQTEGIERIIFGINWILEHAPKGKLLIETTAGAGNIMGDTLEELAEMRDGVKQKDRIGFVLDTQHMWAAGYNFKKDLDDIVKQVDETLGLKNVNAIHLNDSIPQCGSHKDRHANLGEGKIGIETLAKIVNHPKLCKIPFIMETPALKTSEGIGSEMKTLKKIAQ